MLYKNKIKVQNILKSAVALMLMLTLSLSTALSPLAKAEEAKYTWKTLTSAPVPDPNPTSVRNVYISPDGSKLFTLEKDATYGSNLWMSADDGATWRKIWSKQTTIGYAQPSFSADGSKIVMRYAGSSYFYVSTDGGQSWTERHGAEYPIISPDGSFLAGCSSSGGVYTTHISTDDGQTWTQKGTNNVMCPMNVFNNGTMITQSNGDMAKSTDYGQTWTETPNVLNVNYTSSFSNNGNTIFGGDRISLDGGNHWTPSNAPIPAGKEIARTGISDDGKKLFIAAEQIGANPSIMTLITSVDGGRTWHSEDLDSSDTVMSNDGSKMFRMQLDGHNGLYFVGILSTSQPVTPGAGAGGAATPSSSTSATPGQKPGKASGRLAETGISVQLIGGLAVIAVAAGALVLRKRL